MSTPKKTPQSDSVLQWMQSNRLYESYMFAYLLILCFWVAVGWFSFGFEMAGYSLEQNLAFNFMLFLLLVVCACLTPFFHRLIWGRKKSFDKVRENVEAELEKVVDPELREAVIEHLEKNGLLPPNRLQIWALIFLACYFLFELFFISAWVKDYALVWQPDWLDGIIHWMHENTKITDRFTSDAIFTIGFHGSHGDSDIEKIVAGIFEYNEQLFLDSPFGDAAVVFHFLRVVAFIPMLSACLIIFWQFFGWTGMNAIAFDPEKKIRSFLWLLFISIFIIPIMMLGGTLAMTIDLTWNIGMMMGKVLWLREFWKHIIFLFIMVGFKLTLVWIVLIKQTVVNIYRRIIK